MQYQKPFSGAWYVKARLQPTRALGDAYLKHSEFNGPPDARRRGRHIPPLYTPPYITARPETRVHPLRGAGAGPPCTRSFLLLGCDGLWDVMSNEEAVRCVRTLPQAGRGVGWEACSAEVKEAGEGRAMTSWAAHHRLVPPIATVAPPPPALAPPPHSR